MCVFFFFAVSASLRLRLQVFNQHEGSDENFAAIFPPELNIGDNVSSSDLPVRTPPPSPAVAGEASEAASSFQEWPLITDIQRVGGQGGRAEHARGPMSG